MMGDALDSAMEGDAEEEDKVVNQVLDEIGINLKDMMIDAPQNNINANTTVTAADEKQGLDRFIITTVIIIILHVDNYC